jgi:solute:Na+ symporter, SSS family
MSIATASLFTRNIYREYFRPDCTEREESRVAKTVSLLVKIGALVFIVFLPTTLAINFQLPSKIWIIQILPAVFIGLYTNWFHCRALVIGLIGGLAVGTWMVITRDFQSSVYTFHLGAITLPIYAAVAALLANLLICVVLTLVFRGFGIVDGEDETTPRDFEARPVPGLRGSSRIQPTPQSTQQTVGTSVRQ